MTLSSRLEQPQALAGRPLCFGLFGILLTIGCGIEPEPRSALATPQAALRFIGLRTDPIDGTNPKKTLPRAVKPNGAADEGLGKACILLLVESPSFRYSKEKVLCEEWARPPEGERIPSQNSADLTASEAELFQPKALVLSIPSPAELNDANLQRLAESRQ